MYRILIVDDEPMALYSTAHAFPWADWGFDPPVLMTEAPAALDKLRTERFDAAIVDIRMPQMTGIDLIRLSGEAGLQTVFIVLSGYSDFSYVQTALRLSTFDYCLKPMAGLFPSGQAPNEADLRDPVAALERLSGRIHDIRVGSDPAFLATLSSTAPLKPLFTQRGLPVPEGMLSMVLLSAEKPETLPPLLNGFQASLSFWADANEVLLFTPMTEQSLLSTLPKSPDVRVCYTVPVLQDILNPVRQLQLLRQTMAEVQPGQAPVSIYVNDCSPTFFDMLNYVDEHLSDELSLQRLSAQFHLNYTYCSELFRAITGATFTKYLSSHRMERAQTLIITTSMSISEIARQTGYSNYNHFSATFKTYFGQTPGAYRTAHQEGSVR